jgi:hypothetical protein
MVVVEVVVIAVVIGIGKLAVIAGIGIDPIPSI